MVKKLAAMMLVLALAVASLAAPASGQGDGDHTIASGLNNPRHLSYGPDGTLYIAEAGIGGDQEAPGDFGPVAYGFTARVVAVAPDTGATQVVLDNQVSSANFQNFLGVNAVLAEDGRTFVVLGLGPEVEGAHVTGVLVLDDSMMEQRFIDFAAIEAELNPDGDFVVANPIDMAVGADGTYYILDASGNALYSMTGDGEPTLFHVWEDLPVPSGLDVGPDGSIYVSFLSAFPFAAGSARIEQWTPDGELVATYGGLTGATDVLVTEDGTIYAVELSTVFGDVGWEPNRGRVVMVSPDGITPVAEGLNYPYGLAQSPDGTLVVSVNSTFVDAGTGSVIAIESGMMMGGGAMMDSAPAATPEASG